MASLFFLLPAARSLDGPEGRTRGALVVDA
jgi:hypothetical protein